MRPAGSAQRISSSESLVALEGGREVVETTLLELVRAVSESTEDEREVVATVMHLLRSGRVRLVGNFAGTIPDAA